MASFGIDRCGTLWITLPCGRVVMVFVVIVGFGCCCYLLEHLKFGSF
jgi:hypothetical protein